MKQDILADTLPLQTEWSFDLSDSSNTLLHRAGIAGLWMTLKYLEDQYPDDATRPGSLSWTLTSHSVTMKWGGKDFDVLDWILKQAFQIDERGLINFAALTSENLGVDASLVIHNGILNTFLQHNKFCSLGEGRSLLLEINKEMFPVRYKEIHEYKYQNFARELCNEHGTLLTDHIKLSGWIYPGLVAKHVVLGKKTYYDFSSQDAFLLIFAPIACCYFFVLSHSRDKRNECVLVIPEVYDLITYSQNHQVFGKYNYSFFIVANDSEAVLKTLMSMKESGCRSPDGLMRGQYILFGQANWSSHQKIRKSVTEFKITEKEVNKSEELWKYLPGNKVYKDTIFSSLIRGWAADNVLRKSIWYFDFFHELQDSFFQREVGFYRDGLIKMVEHLDSKSKPEALFIKACHQALRSTYAKIYGKTPDNRYPPIERYNIKLKSKLRNCKSSTKFREILSSFFRDAGSIPILEDHWETLLPIMSGETDWRLARDLVSISLASYKKKEKDTSGNSHSGGEIREDTGIQISPEDEKEDSS